MRRSRRRRRARRRRRSFSLRALAARRVSRLLVRRRRLDLCITLFLWAGEGVIRWCERQDRTCLEFRSERTYSGMLPVVISLAGVGTQCANASDPVTPPARAG